VLDEELAFASALDLARLIRTFQVKPVELMELYLSRIERISPLLNCFITVNADLAMKEAAGVERAINKRHDLPPFYGVPIGIKDLADTAGIRTTLGSAGFRNRVPEQDSYIVTRLKDAGFIVAGKTNTPEFGFGCTDPIGYGPCRNPWDIERTVLGSSGGSAAAVAAGLCPIAHGSDGGGSLRLPAAVCGLVGLKPSRGRVSNQMVGSEFLVQEGPLTRTVADAAAMLDCIDGHVTGDPYWAPPPSTPFSHEVGRDPGRLRIAYMTGIDELVPSEVKLYNFQASPSPDVAAAVRLAASALSDRGHMVTEASPDWGGAEFSNAMVWGHGAAWLAAEDQLPPFDTLDPIQQHSLSELRHLNLKSFLSMTYDAMRRSRQVVRFWDGFDVLLLPTVSGPPDLISDLRDERGLPSQDLKIGPFCFFWNITGQPAISLPLSSDSQGLPVAVQLVGRPNDEATLLRISAQLELALPWTGRRPKVS
jgi:amidase